MFNAFCISSGTGIIGLIILYFVVKWSVKNGIKEAYKDIKENESLLSSLKKQYEED